MNKEKNKINNDFFPQTISEYIYNNLKTSIMNNEIKANQRINEKELSDRFHVSRTPIREAVLRLSAEGFVKIDSYKRAIVKELSFKELKEILEVLGNLDSLAIGLFLDKVTQEIIDELEKITKKMEKFCSINTVEKYMKLNEDFHTEIWKHVPNQFLKEMLFFIKDKRARYLYARIFLYKKPGFLEKSLREHKLLMRYIKQKDKKRLESLMIKHRKFLLVSSTKKDKERLKELIIMDEKENKNI